MKYINTVTKFGIVFQVGRLTDVKTSNHAERNYFEKILR